MRPVAGRGAPFNTEVITMPRIANEADWVSGRQSATAAPREAVAGRGGQDKAAGHGDHRCLLGDAKGQPELRVADLLPDRPLASDAGGLRPKVRGKGELLAAKPACGVGTRSGRRAGPWRRASAPRAPQSGRSGWPMPCRRRTS